MYEMQRYIYEFSYTYYNINNKYDMAFYSNIFIRTVSKNHIHLMQSSLTRLKNLIKLL